MDCILQQDSRYFEIVTIKEEKYRRNYQLWKAEKKRPVRLSEQAKSSFKS
jgi:type IV secretory pathway VirB3-like protein